MYLIWYFRPSHYILNYWRNRTRHSNSLSNVQVTPHTNMSKEQNQCDGCMAGKPINKDGNHATVNKSGCVSLQGCTKDRYSSPIQQEGKKGYCRKHSLHHGLKYASCAVVDTSSPEEAQEKANCPCGGKRDTNGKCTKEIINLDSSSDWKTQEREAWLKSDMAHHVLEKAIETGAEGDQALHYVSDIADHWLDRIQPLLDSAREEGYMHASLPTNLSVDSIRQEVIENILEKCKSDAHLAPTNESYQLGRKHIMDWIMSTAQELNVSITKAQHE